MEKLKQLQDLHQQQADQHRNEMAAQSRLSNIYKIASQENDGKVQELVSEGGSRALWPMRCTNLHCSIFCHPFIELTMMDVLGLARTIRDEAVLWQNVLLVVSSKYVIRSLIHSFIHSSLQIKAVEELQKLLNEATASYTNLSDQFSKQAAEINAEIESKQVRGLGKFAYDIAFSQICLLTMTSMLV